MKYEIRKTTNEGIIQITTVDERWYVKEDGKGNQEFVPSVTWIADHYPKGIGFYKWLANHSWDEAEALKEAAADKGSIVHRAIDDLIHGKVIKMDSKYSIDGQEREINPEEYECVMSFVDWYRKSNPKIIDAEFVVWGEGYAGTVDLYCELDGKPYIVDFKSGQNIWPSYELQLSAYKHALKVEEMNLAILQLGYRKNKNKFKFSDIEDKFDLFLAAKQIWANECAGVVPKQKDYPTELSL